jgi:predicted choloylglycine hydrolase
MELLIGTPSYRIEACTNFGLSPQRTTTGETIVAKNFDYLNDLASLILTCETRPKEGYKTLGCKMAPLPGIFEGMNEHGLLATYNLAFTTDKPRNFVPLSIALQEMLETCRSTEEAVKFITQAKRGGHDALLMLADAEGDIKAVEISSNHSATREMVNGQIINTNHYHTEEMQQYEVPRKAVFFGKEVTRDQVGKRVYESSEQRLKRAQELLEGRAKVDEDYIAATLRDHGKDGKPSNLTICLHSEYSSTLRSMIFYPERKVIKVLYGNPCKSEYAEFAFKHAEKLGEEIGLSR